MWGARGATAVLVSFGGGKGYLCFLFFFAELGRCPFLPVVDYYPFDILDPCCHHPVMFFCYPWVFLVHIFWLGGCALGSPRSCCHNFAFNPDVDWLVLDACIFYRLGFWMSLLPSTGCTMSLEGLVLWGPLLLGAGQLLLLPPYSDLLLRPAQVPLHLE